MQGFETRGTEIGKRLTAWHNLNQEIDGNGILFSNPSYLLQKIEYEKTRGVPRHQHPNHRRHKDQRRNHKNNKRRKEKQKKNEHSDVAYNMMIISKRLKATKTPLSDTWMGDSGVFRDFEVTNDSIPSLLEPTRQTEPIEYGHNTTFVDEDEHRERVQTKKSTWRMLKQASLPYDGWPNSRDRQPIEGFFCDSSPHKAYSHFVVKRIGPNATDSLFDLNGMLAMCQLQEQIGAVPSYQAFCEPEMQSSNCCRPWSLPNYVTLLANKSSCFDLNADDVSLLHSLLLSCYEYYHLLKLDINCNEVNRCYAPEECTRNNLVFNVLNFLSDYSFIKPNVSDIQQLNISWINKQFIFAGHNCLFEIRNDFCSCYSFQSYSSALS